MHIIGPLHGILPLGPDGVPAFNTLRTSTLESSSEKEAMLAYKYTLQYQGLSNNIA